MGTSLHPITNWPQYNKSLINLGSLTFWVDTEAMSNWFHHDHHGRRGRSQLYTDQTIATFLMLKGIFNLTLRATQGLLDTLFELMNVPLCAPDYSCASKRARSVTVAYRQPPKEGITDLVIDSTGLKVFGEGEWKVRKHGAEKRRVWRKLHLAVDPVTHDIVAAEVSLENVHDAEVSPTFISQVTNAVMDEVTAWQSRPLHNVYPIVYLDALVVRSRASGAVQNKAVYFGKQRPF
ncbi:IS5 family transposase [Aeromonas veronii]